MTLEELLYVTNDSTSVTIVDAGTGELYAMGTAEDEGIELDETCDYTVDELLEAEVMDINVWDNGLTICIDVENGEF